jgi:hypothetical protein
MMGLWTSFLMSFWTTRTITVAHLHNAETPATQGFITISTSFMGNRVHKAQGKLRTSRRMCLGAKLTTDLTDHLRMSHNNRQNIVKSQLWYGG